MLTLTTFFIIYFVLLVLLMTGWRKAVQEPLPGPPEKETMVSVIIPVRNEQFTIAHLLEGLSGQEYRKFEIIVVNDGSDDDTQGEIRKVGLKNLKVIDNQGKGKKAAITTGVRHANGSIIVTTDADCMVLPGWLRTIVSYFDDPGLKMAFGAVRMEDGKSFFDALQRIEFSSLIGAGAATAALGYPSLCSGANMAFRKKVFLKVKGYEGNLEVPSGDDEFLMRKIHQHHKNGVRFMSHPDVVVTTATQPAFVSFLHQRIRWASKWRYNSSPFAKVLAVLIVAFQVIFAINWLLISTPWVLQSLFLISIKAILEAAFLLLVCRYLGTRWNWLAFLSLQIIYPAYVIGVAIASFFAPFRWKDRIFRPDLKFPFLKAWILAFAVPFLFNFYLYR